jgi:uncharacterized protein
MSGPMVAATTEAADAIRRLRAEEGELIFVQSDGCCDGSALMCFQAGEFRISDGDALIADVAGFSQPAGDGLHFLIRDVTHEPSEIIKWSTP